MRKQKAYIIYDMVSEIYSEWVFPAQNENDAMRAFKGSLENSTNMRKQDVAKLILRSISHGIIPWKERVLAYRIEGLG